MWVAARSGLALWCLVAGTAFAGPLELSIRGAVDPDTGQSTRVTDRGVADAVDLGTLSAALGGAQGDVVAARDGSGTYVVTTLEVEVRQRSAERDLAVPPPAASPRHPGRRRWAASRLPDGPIQVTLSVTGLSPGIEARYSPGTGTDWGAGAGVGTPLGPRPQPIFIASPAGGTWVHQVALFVPGAPLGAVHATTTYAAQTEEGPEQRAKTLEPPSSRH